MRRFGWLLALALAATGAHADAYPTKPIRMIVPFPAGSATDGQARLIGAHFQKQFGHAFIVENMPGATGAIAARAVAKAPPDGYTLLLSFVLYSWQGVHGPPGMPPEIVATLNRAIKDAVSTPEGKRFFGAYGSETGAMTPAEFGAFVKEELKRWDDIVKVTGLPRQ